MLHRFERATRPTLLVLVAVLLFVTPAWPRCSSCPRDHYGRIRRSETARHTFMRATGYPHGRDGYVVDHVVPLACGGTDATSNMQWQTSAAAAAKDKWERRSCER